MIALITLLCVLVALAILAGAFFLAEYVVGKKHRVNVLEDSYKEATDHIASLEREIIGLNQQVEQMTYEAARDNERGARPRAWNPADPLNSATSRQ
jgi:cell division protein FtsB